MLGAAAGATTGTAVDVVAGAASAGAAAAVDEDDEACFPFISVCNILWYMPLIAGTVT